MDTYAARYAHVCLKSQHTLAKCNCFQAQSGCYHNCHTQQQQVEWSVKDGDTVPSGQVLGKVNGLASSILVAERVALNFMQVRGLREGGCLCLMKNAFTQELSYCLLFYGYG